MAIRSGDFQKRDGDGNERTPEEKRGPQGDATSEVDVETPPVEVQRIVDSDAPKSNGAKPDPAKIIEKLVSERAISREPRWFQWAFDFRVKLRPAGALYQIQLKVVLDRTPGWEEDDALSYRCEVEAAVLACLDDWELVLRETGESIDFSKEYAVAYFTHPDLINPWGDKLRQTVDNLEFFRRATAVLTGKDSAPPSSGKVGGAEDGEAP